MQIREGIVHFESSDMAFVNRFGPAEAADMVLDFKSAHSLPFLYDTYQMAAFFHTSRKKMFTCVKNADCEYRCVTIKKINGGERRLYVPCPALRIYQSKILHDILAELPVSPYATAYVRGKNLAQNAAPHVKKRFVLTLDITDFFGSIRFDQVYSAAFNARYFPRQIGVMLTALCCRRDVLPQGAPTSPALSNLVMRNFDDSIGEWCTKRGVAYTRYCDDMTFSADHPLSSVYCKVKDRLTAMGFSLNERKTRFAESSSRQSVTGLTVNEKLKVSGEYKRRLRQEVYYTLKFGPYDSIRYANKTAFIGEEGPEADRYLLHLAGRLNYVLQIEPDSAWFQNALNEIQKRQAELCVHPQE